ncbi:hypothetical protein MLD38_035954 [Melastoma candidum]|uniref:Uncharacterized protein n=1 Tax=Melastoma candidum TaxID=119954 RepID=A0ACB9LIL1_9MYRT|nr:hypothetical protein MLD38_035954 [Melastoma candidum]
MQQQQHLMQMQPMMASYYPNNVTSDHIQQYLDENKSLILKIVESQNSGKMNECAENQARLQSNLMYLAAIADSQPQQPALHSQFATSGMMQPGHYMQQQQAQQMTQQSLMAARSSMLYSQQPYASMEQQAAVLHGQLSMGSGGGASGGINILQAEASHSGSSLGGFLDFGRNKHEMGNSSSAEGGRGGSTGNGKGSSDGGENLYLKSADDGN